MGVTRFSRSVRWAMALGVFAGVGIAVVIPAQEATSLWRRGFSVIPAPQKVQLRSGEVGFGPDWRLDDQQVGSQNIAVRALLADLAEFHHLQLERGTSGRVLRLAVTPGTVETRLKPAIDKQGYRLSIKDDLIEVTGNAQPGLFYGVQTLLQLLQPDRSGQLRLPQLTIEDWPRLQLRFLHWDTKHHQDRIATLKRYLDWGARFKINMIGFELEDKFEYPSHPVIGAPGAFTMRELQEIVDYGLARFIQVVPVIQAPAHLAYVLKHPEFADLRADGNNYQSKLSDPRTCDLIFSMYDDVIKATRGVDYLFASTDEVYYAGIDDPSRPYTPENRSLAWVEFVRRAHDHLSQQGRRMLIWAEYPLLPGHVAMIPPDVIDGVIGEEAYLPIEKRIGMRQLAYVSMQGEERLFPNHLTLPGEKMPGRLAEAAAAINTGQHWQGDPIGAFGAAWDDSGLHDETFWLGWSAVAQYAWNPGGVPVTQHVAEFMNIFYGPQSQGLIDIYRLMQRQARAWEGAWDRTVSRVRRPGYGNSRGPGQGTTRYDLTLAMPRLPTLPNLDVQPFWAGKYRTYLAVAQSSLQECDALVAKLQRSLAQVERNQYNLEVFLSLARFMRHHWQLLAGLAEVERLCAAAHESAEQHQPARAAAQLRRASDTLGKLRTEGEEVFDELRVVYEKSRFPKGQSAGGRSFLHVLDDTKDHWADRTADLSFMMAPEHSLDLEHWQQALGQLRAEYVRQNHL